MPKTVGREEVRLLTGEGALLIEVLPADEYEALHLPGAINLPLKELGPETTKGLDRNRPIIAYCFDLQ